MKEKIQTNMTFLLDLEEYEIKVTFFGFQWINR